MPRIVYEITASGGIQVARLFEGIADAAGRAQQKLDRQARQTSTGLRLVSSSMAEVRAASDAALGSLGPVGSVLGSLGTAGVAGAAVAGITALGTVLFAGAKRAAEFADELDDSAKRIGLGVESLQEYRFAAQQVGVSQESLQRGLQVFVRNIGAAQLGSDTLAQSLKGIDTAFLDAIKSAGSTEQQLDLVVTKIASLSSVTEQARVAQVFFGKSAGDLVPLFAAGAEGIQRFKDRARELGIVIDEDLITKGSSANDRLEELSATIRGNLTSALLNLAPTLEAAAAGFSTFVGAAGKAIDQALGLSLQGKLDQLEERIRNLRAASAGPGGQPADVNAPLIADLQRQLEQLQAAGANAAEARRQAQVTASRGAQQAEALRASDAGLEAARKASPTDEDKLRKLDVERQKSVTSAENARRLEVLSEEEFKARLLEIETRFAAAKAKVIEEANRGTKQQAEQQAEALERLEKSNAEARRRAASTGLTGEAKVWQDAKNALDAYQEEVQAAGLAEAKSRALVAERWVTIEQEAQKEVAKLRDDEAQKRADAEKAIQNRIRSVSRAAIEANANTEAGVWERAKADFDDFAADIADAIDDQQRRVELLAEFWVERERQAAAQIVDIRAKAAEKAAQAAEAAQQDEAQAQERVLQPFANTLENIQRQVGDTLVDAFLRGGDAAQSFEDVALDVIRSIAGQIAQLALSKVVVEPLLGALGGAGATAAGAAVGAATPGAATQDLAKSAEAASAALDSSTSELLKLAGAAVATAGAVYAAGAAIASGAGALKQASYGQNAPGNALAVTAGIGTAAGIGSGAAIGATVGSAVPGIGTAIGALVGAAVGAVISAAITNELSGALSSGIKDGVKAGLTQAQLDKQVGQKVSQDLLLNIISGGLNTVLAPLLSPLFTPDIERIFEKILRQQLGGVGGYSTAGIPVNPSGTSGLGTLAAPAGRAGRIIAEGFGAGGAAYGDEREGRFRSVLLAVTRRESEKSGEEAGTVLAQVFAAAFQGSFTAALAAAMKTGTNRRSADFQFVAQQFTRASGNFGFNYQAVADVVERQGRAPGTDARKAATEAFSGAFKDALANAADSSAFRRSLANAVQEAFAGKATQLLSKSFGDLLAPFFALSKDARREFRRARRRGDVAGGIEVLTEDFEANVDAFAQVAADPAIAKSFAALTDALLKLQVASSVAAGDVKGAADAIEAALSSSIAVVRDYQQLSRDLRSRSRIAAAGPGVAQDQVALEELRRSRQEQETVFYSKYPSAYQTPESVLIRGLQTDSLDPAAMLDDLRAFADARLAELEAEIALARQLEQLWGALVEQFRGFRTQVEQTLGTFDPTGELARQIEAVTTARAAATTEDPDSFTKLATAVGTALATASARFQELAAAIETFDGIARGITETLGGLDGQAARLTALQGTIQELVPTVVGGGAGASEATAKLAAQLSEGVAIATSRRTFFQGAQESFEGIAGQAGIAARGPRAQRQQLAARRAELQALLPAALRGDADALAKAQTLASQVLGLAGTGGRGRRVAAEVEAITQQLAKAAEGQVTVAEQQLLELKAAAETAKAALEGQKTAVAQQLEQLKAIALDAQATAELLRQQARDRVTQAAADLKAFQASFGPLLAYLTNQANATLHGDLARIEAALGTEGAIVKALDAVKARLPVVTSTTATRTTSGLAATSAAPAVTISGPIVIQFQQPPKTQAEAREYGRMIGDALTERIQQVVSRGTLKKVA